MTRRLIPIVAIVIVANLAALVTVARDRSGSPDARVQMTERELRLVAADLDSTARMLTLAWREGAPSGRSEPWLTREKLVELGFDCSVDPQATDATRHYSPATQPPRFAFVVLEYRGNEAAEAAPPGGGSEVRRFEGSEVRAPDPNSSRLRAIDAGLNRAELRRRYPDRDRFILTSGMVRSWLRRSADDGRRNVLGGTVAAVFPSDLYVPTEYLAALKGLSEDRQRPSYMKMDHEPRYDVTVEYGSSLMPRIVGITRRGR